MSRTSWQTLVLIAVGCGLIAFVVLENLHARGSVGIPTSYITGVGPAVLAVILFRLGRNVRKLVRQEPTSMTPIGASRVVVLAKASALVGSALVGYFTAQVVVALGNITAPYPREQALAAGIALLACLGLVIVAMIVEWWCYIPPDDEDDPPSGGANHSASAA
ncbi:DUF3180 domain-containing protein [Georgenia deserti]|uniref:DUF3180 domain-containing protein n=1 Tax=Georgenia deserti TaxID=2093781 RepID=A0ABW4L0Q7_9MICO